MLKVSDVGRWPLAVGLTCALWGLSSSQEARAGQWIFTKEFDGSKSSSTPNTPTSWKRDSMPPGLPSDAYFTSESATSTTATVSSASASTSGTITYICKWTPSFVGEMVPKAVLIPTSAGSSLRWRASDPNPTSSSGSANDGVHDAPTKPSEGTVTVETNYKTLSWGSNSRLLHALDGGGEISDGSTKTWRVSVHLSADVSGSVATNNGQSVGYIFGLVSANADQPVEDTRSVKLSRGGSYEREELKNGDWHTYGDSIYSAFNLTDAALSKLVPLSMSANYTGEWSKKPGGFLDQFIVWDVTPKWSLDGFTGDPTSDENGASGKTNLGTPTVKSGYLGYNWTYKGSATGPQEFSTSYTATDNVDQASSTAHYHLTLHDPVEQIGSNTPTILTVHTPLENSDGVVGWFGKRDPRNPTVPKVTIKVGTSSVTGYSLKGTIDVNPFEDLLGFSAEAKQESAKTIDVEMDTDIPEIPIDKFGYIEVIHTFQRRHTKFWAYDASGKIKNLLGPDGAQVEWPHEAFQDEKMQPDFHWVFVNRDGFDTKNLVRETLPDPVYDSQRGAV